MKKQKALTLIELLISSSIIVMVMASIYSAFHSGIFSFRNIENSIDIYQAARSIAERINLDLRNSFAYKQDNAIFSGTGNKLNFLTLMDTFSIGPDKFNRDFAFISYYSEEDRLMRLCRLGQDSLKELSETKAEELASGVEIEFQYGRAPTAEEKAAGQTGPIFQDSWADNNDDEKQKLPLAVKVKLTIKNNIEEKFERIIYLPLGKSDV